MIITFGSLNADMVYRVHLAPEEGQTVTAHGFSSEAGGKGANQALAAARDGAEVMMCGAVGRDPLAETALHNLIASKVDISSVDRVDEPTGNAVVLVDQRGHNRITVSPGANSLASADQLAGEDLQCATCVLLQLETPVSEVEKLLLRCKDRGVLSILNLAPAKTVDLTALKAAGLLIVNDAEAESLAGQLGCEAGAEGLAKGLGVDVLRTLGAKGAEVFTNRKLFFEPALTVSAIDTTAAGDCFIGVLAAGIDRGVALPAAMRRATAAAAICCTRPGSQSSIPFAEETDQLIAAGEDIHTKFG